jgi:hypothetical protein
LASVPLGKRPSTHGIGDWSNEVEPWYAQKVSEHVVKTVIRNKYNIFRKCPCCIIFPILHVLYFIIKLTPLSELTLRLNCVLTRKTVAEFKGLGCLNTTMTTTHTCKLVFWKCGYDRQIFGLIKETLWSQKIEKNCYNCQ